MRDAISRLRAVLTPQTLLILLALVLLTGTLSFRDEQQASPLEKRIARALSAMEGAGEVHVVIKTSARQGTLGGAQGSEMVCGAVAVAQGAHDPLVRLELQEALCALLDLPAQRVSVVVGER